jgi:DNA-binding response OmpR family regulator
MNARFVVALVDGFEWTLDEVLSRPISPELRAAVKGLLSQIAAARSAIAEIDEESNASCAGS